MKSILRKIFRFILKYFESGDEPYTYKPQNRVILITVGILFSALAAVSLYLLTDETGVGYLIPVVVFLGVGVVCLIVGTLGTDRAIAKIWGNR